jgi:DUF971 family protein
MNYQSNAQSYIVKKITQVDNHSFEILWGDGSLLKYFLRDLQDKCPCASCVDGPKNVSATRDVRAVNITNVGRYALRIQFLTGCSQGIFGFDMLRGKLN